MDAARANLVRRDAHGAAEDDMEYLGQDNADRPDWIFGVDEDCDWHEGKIVERLALLMPAPTVGEGEVTDDGYLWDEETREWRRAYRDRFRALLRAAREEYEDQALDAWADY